jgi:hypothetical protein
MDFRIGKLNPVLRRGSDCPYLTIRVTLLLNKRQNRSNWAMCPKGAAQTVFAQP